MALAILVFGAYSTDQGYPLFQRREPRQHPQLIKAYFLPASGARRSKMSIPAKLTIFRNKRGEEVARVIFDEGFPPGWRIESKARQSFEHKFTTELEAFKAWQHDFDPETGRLVHRQG